MPDVNELLPLVDDIPPVHRKADRPRGVPDNLYADRAYDSQPHRQELEAGDSIPTWHGVGPNTAVAWGSIAGWRSGPCRGCTAFAGSGCGPIERVRSMMPSSRWLQLSYVCGSYDKVFLLGALRTRRVLVILDGLSEMVSDPSAAEQDKASPIHPDFPAAALIATSRTKDVMKGTHATIQPTRIDSEHLSRFMNAYLAKAGCPDFEKLELFRAPTGDSR